MYFRNTGYRESIVSLSFIGLKNEQCSKYRGYDYLFYAIM